MRKTITAVAFLALIGAPAALAQSRTNTGSGSTAAPSSHTTNSAPVGHRQPTAADVAKEQPTMSDEEREKRDRALEKRLQICRGC